MKYTIASMFYRVGNIKLRRKLFKYPIGVQREEIAVFDEIQKKWVTSND
ncbi:hypothetical protein [Liquorilactobacillus satsumensis]|nr:hypothetical protein [Liquorilactobacillus satsumensis]MCP9313839.1 hypothetical protein [Liquorilactobacillus satsumensis]MCP9360980.1 hypothetical protein [Liquorilactobacillus satsumensis]